MKIAIGQINSTVGDIDGNVEKILAWSQRAESDGCQMIVFPELATCGYPPEDLLLKNSFRETIFEANEEIIKNSGACTIAFGTVGPAQLSLVDMDHSYADSHAWVREHVDSQIFNQITFASNGFVKGIAPKYHLPNYSVFDELRYFLAGNPIPKSFPIGQSFISGMVCEDIWKDTGPTAMVPALTKLVVVANASPFHVGKQYQREALLRHQAARMHTDIVYVNCVGGQDELVFDGNSFVMSANGEVIARCSAFEEQYTVVDTKGENNLIASQANSSSEEIFNALVLGTREYVHKTGFSDVVIGISGGIDSAVVAAIARFALGPDHVHGIMLPSRYSSDGSLIDGEAVIKSLDIHEHIIDIEGAHHAVERGLKTMFDGTELGVAEENVQARLRGIYLMAVSNKFNWLVLTTGNKSEMAVGYATLYGDMAGGFNPLKDVYKTDVWHLAGWINQNFGRELIPEVIINKKPSAELRPDQFDQDSLPPYPVLDRILRKYIEQDAPLEEIAILDNPATVERVAMLVDRNEYKRRQAAPGVRISPKAFGRDRRLPIANAFHG